ncbi:DUF7490 domain-containing protein [Methanoregula sp.]|uniref:DUF7490 domain-containing protein n=1 Tax=Methanoregula sp. TaxID=2052170 RepID=UPI002D13AA4F|nr:hypothetical protein [Methanoregula sp.]HVP97346.1 hypothetical protein [Methanoregula sp.]
MNIRDFCLYAPLLLIVVALVAGAGCLSTVTTGDNSAGPVHSHYEYQDSWSPEYGCYTHLTGYVYNAGNVSTQNLRLDFNLVNTGTGTIRDSRSVYIGSIAPGDTKNYESILDGDCTQDYRVDVAFENP